MVTYHLSKNLRPRTFLVFMVIHPFENVSPHTFLVFMENHPFKNYGGQSPPFNPAGCSETSRRIIGKS